MRNERPEKALQQKRASLLSYPTAWMEPPLRCPLSHVKMNECLELLEYLVIQSTGFCLYVNESSITNAVHNTSTLFDVISKYYSL